MERLSAAFQSAIAVLVGGIFRVVGQFDSNGSLQDPHLHDPGTTTCAGRRHQLKRDHPTTSSEGGGGSGSDAEHSSKKRSCQNDSLPKPEHCEDDKGGERLTKIWQIPTIMTEIVKWLPPKDLIQLRPTSKLWNSVSTKELKATHAHALRVKVTGECAGMVKRLGRLATTIGKNQDHLFAKLLLTISRGSGEERRLFTYAPVLNLFSVWGQHLTHLEIKQREWFSSRTSQNLYITGLRHILFNCTPALIELKLTWDKGVEPDVDGDDTYKELPHLQKLILELGSGFIPLERDLIRAATGLQSLGWCTSSTDTERLLRYMRANPTLCHSLKDLVIGTAFEDSLAKLIALSRNNGWQLQKVNFHVFLWLPQHRQPQLNLTTEFLSLHSEHLIELKLLASGFMGHVDEAVSLRIPRMHALETLVLDTSHPANVKFDGCPALKNITLSHVQFDLNAWTTCLAPFSSSPVRELNMASEWNAVESNAMVDILATQFPHLNRLTVCIRRECLPRVWSAWPMLEVLDITVSVDEDPMDDGETSRYMDHELTGIQPADCTLLRENIAKIRIDYEDAMGMKVFAGIADMKSLREFRFKWSRVAGGTQISDVSGYYAFAASNLQRISIRNDVKFSDNCLAAIRQQLGPGSRIEFLK